MSVRAFVLLALALVVGRATAEDPSWTSKAGLYVVSYESELQPIEINTLHAWVIHLRDAAGNAIEGAVMEVSGGMPVHDHGLPTRPRVTTEMGGGDYRLDGMRFHMAGEWQVTLSITVGSRTDSVVISLTL